ncbi:uncharacterized protein LOC144652448 [Oculina patagonica]
MSSSTLLEVFGHVVFSFTRDLTEHYNPEEPEFTAESFGYDPLQSTGREWHYLPIDELIYQEYSDREITSFHYLPSSRLNVRLMNACSPEENEETREDQQDEDRAMAWKRFRPSALHTVCKSMYIGALISLITATIIGSVYMLTIYLSYKTLLACEYLPKELIPVRVQWMRTISDLIACVLFYAWSFINLLLLFRPYQLKGLKRKLILVSCVVFCLDALYRIILQAVGKPYYRLPISYFVPVYICFIANITLKFYVVAKSFNLRAVKVAILICKMTTPTFLFAPTAFFITMFVYPVYNKQNREGKLLIALFAPLIGVVIKVISRICVQQLWNITHPGYSYVLLAPSYFGLAVMFRVLQAELDSLQSIAILGVIHGAAEVIERSTMVVIDHICHVIWKRTSAPWGSFRTPRRERLMADIAIMSMLTESIAIVSVNGFLYLYQFIYLQNDSLINLLQSFVVHTSVQLVIEWFFTSMSLAIETRYQNMAVMAVWGRQWKRHFLVSVVTTVPVAVWSSTNLWEIVHGRFNESLSQPCKMPFS